MSNSSSSSSSSANISSSSTGPDPLQDLHDLAHSANTILDVFTSIWAFFVSAFASFADNFVIILSVIGGVVGAFILLWLAGCLSKDGLLRKSCCCCEQYLCSSTWCCCWHRPIKPVDKTYKQWCCGCCKKKQPDGHEFTKLPQTDAEAAALTDATTTKIPIASLPKEPLPTVTPTKARLDYKRYSNGGYRM